VNAPPEVCDDGNANACGTCNATCLASQFTKATGYIDSTTSGRYVDGETFTVGDGINPPVTFEFEKFGGVVASHVRVDVPSGRTQEQMAVIIRDAINNVGASLRIAAAITTPLDVVRLTHELEGSFGNQPISETVVESSQFSVNGMSGGSGVDCPEGTGCKTDSDCNRGLVCVLAGTTGTCETPAPPPVDGLTSRQ
jgi:hypothetical protein